jgi:hypothetical protein
VFKIRQEQMEAYWDERIGESRSKIIRALQRSLPDLTFNSSEIELKELFRRAIYKAAKYGIGTEANLYRFVAAMLVFGEDFDVNPKTGWSQEFLCDPLIEEDHKARLLELRIAIETGRGI